MHTNHGTKGAFGSTYLGHELASRMLIGYWVHPNNRSSLCGRQDEEVGEQEEQDGNSENEAEEEEFYAIKALWDAEENPEIQLHSELTAIKVKCRIMVPLLCD